MIKLYGVPLSRAGRCLWMLEELGLPYENIPVHFATGDTRKPEYLKKNPNGHIPTLEDGDLVLFESMAINLYLARKYGKDLWPGTPEDEGRAWQWSFWGMTECEEPLLTALLHRAVYPEAQRDAAKADDAERRLAKPLAVLDGFLAGRKWLVGDAFGVADLNVASVLLWLRPARIDLSPFPNAARWVGECASRPAAQKLRGR